MIQLVNKDELKDAQMFEEEQELPLPELLDASNILTDDHLRMVCRPSVNLMS